MASHGSNKNPPILGKQKSYADWVRLINIWVKFTDLENARQGPAIVMSLEGKALDAILELNDQEISHEDGVKKIITKLDSIYKRDPLTEKFAHLEEFESFMRTPSSSIQQFKGEFDRRYGKLKNHGVTISDDLLGFKLLKSANLSLRDEQLVKATVSEVNYEIISKKIKAIFYSDDQNSSSNTLVPNIKGEEETFCTEDITSDDEQLYDNDTESSDDDNCDILYTNQTRRNDGRFRYRKQRHVSFSKALPNKEMQSYKRRKGRNPMKNGAPTRCNICQSINHWQSQCPDKHVTSVTYMVNEVILHASSNIILKSLVAETWNSAVLDCGATSTVCGKAWFDEYILSLVPSDREKIVYTESNKPYRFGDGRVVHAIKGARAPVMLGSQPVLLETDIVDADIPLLLSKKSMKKVGMRLHFDKDCVELFGKEIPLNETSNGLYYIPLTKSKQLIDHISNDDDFKEPVILTLTSKKTNKDIATKLHRAFAHPGVDKLLRLLDHAGPQWSENQELKQELKNVTDNCQTCKIYKKAPPRPVVALPMAMEFQEVVAMDLKEYDGKLILHLIDLCTRLSAGVFIPNKNKETIIEHIFKIWIAVYGSPLKFLADNGGEFANYDFIQMCECLGINVCTTAAESPWSNGVVERNNQTLASMMDKIIEDTKCKPELALVWALSAKTVCKMLQDFHHSNLFWALILDFHLHFQIISQHYLLNQLQELLKIT